MDESPESLSPNHSQPGTPPASLSRPPGSNFSGLTLVLPALKDGKPVKGAKSKQKTRLGYQPIPGARDAGIEEQNLKVVRPVKLKPLKEVLTKLITQIKKKDDYAFFLKPVDPSQVPGYSDVVKRPMDLGTMTIKVARGRYRSLEDFTTDFRLVTGNAKLFNPPETIYHTEADRIEAWGLDHISKSASTVIQYETDWNIEIEKDDEDTVNIDDDDDYRAETPMDVDGPVGRSSSIASQVQPGTSRRGVRAPYKKSTTNANKLSESIDVEGRLPGSKDGLGAFPPGSTMAKTMLALKLKGKRYRTKKEKIRVEKEGPPYRADGSLDYTEMEDPFSILSVFVPDPPSRPYLTPLYPPTYLSTTTIQPQSKPDSQWQSDSQPQTQASTPQPSAAFPTPVNIPLPLHRTPPQSTLPTTTTAISSAPKRRRYWTITRNAPTRSRVKDKDDDDPTGTYTPPWKLPREAHAVDFGSFALLAGELAEEMKARGITAADGVAGEEEERVFDAIRESLDCEASEKKMHSGELEAKSANSIGANARKDDYWTTQRTAEAEEYIRDVVYGGVDGLAYVRSLAEFVSHAQFEDLAPTPITDTGINSSSGSGLGRPLSKWVEQTIIDPVTEGRHKLLSETAFHLASHLTSNPFIQHTLSTSYDKSTISTSMPPPKPKFKNDREADNISAQVAASLYDYPAATQALSALLQIRMHKIDMGALIQTPAELFLSEEEWAGKGFKAQPQRQDLSGKEEDNMRDVERETEEPEKSWMDVDTKGAGDNVRSNYELEGPEEMNHVLVYVAGVIIDLDRNIREGRRLGSTVEGGKGVMEGITTAETMGKNSANVEGQEESISEPSLPSSDSPLNGTSQPEEDPTLRNLRLNLLALAKRAPLDTIARLPKDLVPEHIRHFVPTLTSN